MARPGHGRAVRRRGAVALAVLPFLLGVKVYHSQAEALAIAFPDATSVEAHQFVLDEATRRTVSARAASPVREHLVTFYEARRGASSLGHAVVLKETGKSLPFRFLVSIRPGGAVDQVLVLDYREPRGYEIERSSFLRQFRSRTLGDPIRRGRDIRNITGATLSVDSLARGVRRALALYEALIHPPRSP